MSYLTDYFDLVSNTGEHAVLCPFPHKAGAIEYNESNPSAHVNTTTGVFHCKVCSAGFNDLQFIQKITGCSNIDSYKIQRMFNTDETKSLWDRTTTLDEASLQTAYRLGFSDAIVKELNIKSKPKEPGALSYPVLIHNHLCDIRTYNPGHTPKVKSRKGESVGLIIPFDTWIITAKKNVTLICAGEKDMTIARQMGFNAITLTGGERALPMFKECFRDRHIAIVYDNDEAGHLGANALAAHLYKYTQNIKVVTSFHSICKEHGEDIHDFFMKYGKTKQDLIKCIEDTPNFTPKLEEEFEKEYPMVSLYEASKNYVNTIVKSNIQVTAITESSFNCPTTIVATKTKDGDAGDRLVKGELRTWELFPDNHKDILHIIDNGFKETIINDNIRRYLLKTGLEKNVPFKTTDSTTVFKVYVTDLYETSDSHTQPMEYMAYSLAGKLESGKKYAIKYKLVPHPYHGQTLTMIITEAEQASDSVSKFILDDRTKKQLDLFKVRPEVGLDKTMEIFTEMAKGFIGYNGNNSIIQTIDLAYHTVLSFDFGRQTNIRGYLDTLIVGESRTGKSSTADALRKLYNLGTFTSLAGNSATIAGLIGGSARSGAGTIQTRAGVIPQNHKGLIIFEEFGKCEQNILKELTDIRSSNEVRIARVSGSTVLPALVRMIALTNVKNTTGAIKSIASYPNGISVVTELVATAEDIARYDIILVMSDKAANDIDPLWEPIKAFDPEDYRTRVRWVWSRTKDQVVITPDLQRYIVEKCNELNKIYNCHIKIFGPEAWKKVSRLAIAVAGYVASTDETYENIVVQQEHIDYAIKYLINIYDNETFKLREYVFNEHKYTKVDEDSIAALQAIYDKFPTLVLQLENYSNVTRSILESTTGLTQDDLKKGLQVLTRAYFIKVDRTDISPTERFRGSLNQVNKNTYITKLGEE